MERSLLWSALALGCVGFACGLLLARARRGEAESDTAPVARLYLLAAFALPVVVFLLTLPGRPPFAEGQGWGRGFLLGGLAVLLSGWLARRSGPAEGQPLRAAALVAAPWSLAIVMTAIPLLWMRGTVLDALSGVALGWLAVSLILYMGLSPGASHLASLLLTAAAFAITLCGVAMLGVYRGPLVRDVPKEMWSAVALAFAAGLPLVVLLSALPAPLFARIGLKLPLAGALAGLAGRLFAGDEAGQKAARAWRLILAVALLLLLGWLLSAKAVPHPKLLYVAAVGLLAGLLAWWLAAEEVVSRKSQVASEDSSGSAQPQPSTLNPQSSLPHALLSSLVLLAAFMVASQLLQGFGVGMMLLTAWLAAGLALSAMLERGGPAGGHEVARRTAGVMVFGALLLLYRLYTTRYEGMLEGVVLGDHYALFGLLLGAALPALLAAVPVQAPGAPGGGLPRLAMAGALALAVPGALILLWGGKCALALLVGLALSGAITGIVETQRPGEDSGYGIQDSGSGRAASPVRPFTRSPLPLFFALAVALALVQWTGHALPWADMTRAEKVRLLTWVAGGLIVLMLVSDYGGRIAGRRGRRPEPSAPAGEGAQP